MRRVTHIITGAALVGGLSLLGAPAAYAQESVACDAYAQTCPVVLGETLTRGEDAPAAGGGAGVEAGAVAGTGATTGAPATGATTGAPASLPFTGGDVVLLAVLGAAAIAGGAALVVSGRRRSTVAV